ncbi:hypothetical protein AX774_g11 [Zancudomyces culisetae]|uniref:Uncharacterized protein n=1 Tax=Zancudomyces culisetae TaxID=1213189 RepID=A0A1R1PZP5_ZANCU|nr:hypothetical protein AX774_g11 [Zancudomyces culisetae]|eukprot:OMH86423.1 hypothetical protein AX774_g11 [Zancudomyces culisetae]
MQDLMYGLGLALTLAMGITVGTNFTRYITQKDFSSGPTTGPYSDTLGNPWCFLFIPVAIVTTCISTRVSYKKISIITVLFSCAYLAKQLILERTDEEYAHHNQNSNNNLSIPKHGAGTTRKLKCI